MNTDEFTEFIIDHLSTATGISVTTEGRERRIRLPSVVLSDIDSTRDRYGGGHQTYATTLTDNQDREIGERHHVYWTTGVTIEVRSRSESDRFTLAQAINESLYLYEDRPQDLHADFRSLTVGGFSPAVLLAREPNWYQGRLTLEIGYVEVVDDTDHDTLESVSQDLDPDYSP